METVTREESVKVFIGNIVHCDKPFSLVHLEKNFLIVKGSKIVAVGSEEQLKDVLKQLKIKAHTEIRLSSSQILIPGLIDTHIHAPQYPNIGLGYDLPLLEWLKKYTYPLESQYDDLDFSKTVFNAVVRKTLSFGTTTACYFGSMFLTTSQVLVDAVIAHGQRAFVGKINMTENAPANYIETPENSIKDTEKFIAYVKNKKNALVEPIITPRFALSVNLDTMTKLGKLAEEHGCNIQSHIAENKDEVKIVIDKYKCSYPEVYNKAHLLGKKTVLAHGCYLTDSDLGELASKGTSIAHCPSSNTRLQSGLCDVRELTKNGVNVGLGTDVSGGDSMSIIETMRRAVDVSIHLSFSKTNYKPLNYSDALYLATLGGAKALNIEEKVGNFETGKHFDAIVVDMDVNNSSMDYIKPCSTLELLQKFIYVGDDRNVQSVYVAGARVK